MSNLKSLIVIVLLGVVGGGVFFYLFDNYSPLASMDLILTRKEVIKLAREYLAELDYQTAKQDADANFTFDSGIAFYLQNELGLVTANKILRADTLSAHYWNIYFFNRKQAPSQMRHRFRVWISPTGQFLGFTHILPDTVIMNSIEEDEAKNIAQNFLIEKGLDIDRFELESSTANQHINRRDFFFKWTRKDSVFNMVPKYWVRVQGDKIGGFRYDLQAPQAFRSAGSKVETYVTFIITASSIATFVLLVFVIALFLKKYHEGEVGIRTAIGVFVILFAFILLEYMLKFTTIGYGSTIGDVNRFNVRIIFFVISVFIVQAFLAAMVFAAWSVGESSARRGWNKVLKAVDGLIQRKPFTLELANAVTRGYSFGLLFLGLVYGTAAIVASQMNFGLYTIPLLNGVPESFSPSVSAIFLALRVAILNEIVFRLFFISWLREKTKKTWPGILVSSFLWMLVAFILWDFPLGFIHFALLFPLYFLISVGLGWILVKYDLLTAIFANFVVLALTYAVPILAASSPFHHFHSLLFLGMLSVPLVLAVIGYVKKDKVEFTPELTPSHIRRISERERMAQELEIARNVQMSLLPKKNPLIEGYDIAGICIPALEVGGDYYDFFHLGNGKFGIAIGDVSGKGVPAAIYMTLTKGILQSHAGEVVSPKEVLNKLNWQMYDNIERNTFVSMFYAVIDMEQHTIRFSRAGHNPAILAQRGSDSNRLLEPKGIAVGLEKGEKFYSFLEEHEIQLVSGDVLTFYTDGFTEATTKNGDEYGEDRLISTISQNKDFSANVIIQKVVRAVNQFVGNHPQHDDMTMVVIKVL